jgi:hypothetical protein
MCLLIGNGGSRPLSRSTRQSPSSEPATNTLERTNQQIDDEREKERQQQGDDETAWRASVDPNAASTVTPSTEKVAPPHRGRLVRVAEIAGDEGHLDRGIDQIDLRDAPAQ